MYIEPIPPIGKSERWAPNWTDRAWMIMQNQGSGADGASQARCGDVACLLIVGTTTYVDANSVTVSIGCEAKEAETGVAPIGLVLGAWHDTPLVGGYGKIQCHGWDNDTLLLGSGTAANDVGSSAIAVTAEPYVLSEGSASGAEYQTHATVAELVANMPGGVTALNRAVFWRA